MPMAVMAPLWASWRLWAGPCEQFAWSASWLRLTPAAQWERAGLAPGVCGTPDSGQKVEARQTQDLFKTLLRIPTVEVLAGWEKVR